MTEGSTADAARRTRILWTGALFAFAGVNGAALQSRGALLASFEREWGVSETLLGLVTPVGTLGFVGVVLAFGMAAGRVEARKWLLAGIAVTAVGFLAMGAAPVYLFLLAMIAARSAGTGVIAGLDRPLLSHLYPSGRGRIYNLHTMAWAVGATLGPLLVTAVLLVGPWRLTYVVLAAMLVPIILAIWRLEVPDQLANERSFAPGDLPDLLRRPVIGVMALSLVLVGGAESVFFTWLPYYAGQFYDEGLANATLSVFLAAYVPGRFVYSRLAGRVRYTTLVLGSAIVGLGALAATLSYPGGYGMLAGVFVVGFVVSGFFPTLLAWGTDQRPEFSGPINAVAIASAQVGFFVFPALVGVLADAYSIERAMWLQLALIAGLLALTVLGRWHVARNG